jgi:methylated-DNA-[protein]-cysteine S-methyltransferase
MKHNWPVALRLERMPSPIGTLLLVTDTAGCIRALDFEDYEARTIHLLRRYYGTAALQEGAAPVMIKNRIERYFAGELAALEGLPCATNGTAFQHRVWAALLTIPAGQTISYGELAARSKNPGAARAVGAANGANPISLVVPCHRVIGANGTLTGYGGGLARKQWLLAHEGALEEKKEAAFL